MVVYKIAKVTTDWFVPVGISFICFQSCAYLIDISKEKIKPEKNIISFLTYSLLFTKLVQGPIMNYKTINEQLNNRKESFSDLINGFIRFAFGLFKKVIIASFIYESIINCNLLRIFPFSSSLSWFHVICYGLYLYYDFSAYSDMAVGLSKMFGFEVIENFNYPYTSLSITDFWRRWHISLSLWFKEYLYIPLGGSKKGKLLTCINVAIVFIFTGIWHGFNWNYLIWGIYYAFIMVIEKSFLYNLLSKNKFKFLNVIYVFVVVSVGWCIFMFESNSDILISLKEMFIPSTGILIYEVLTIKTVIGLTLGIIFIGFIQKLIKPKLDKYKNNSILRFVTLLFAFILVIVSTYFIIVSGYSPSVYGGF